LIVQLDREIFDSLPINAVGHACFEPMVPVYQGAMRSNSSQNPHDVRAKFYQSLSQGQQALFMFFTYYDHAIRSKDEFQRISSHYLSAHIFDAVKKGVRYFDDSEMFNFLTNVEQVVLSDDDLDELYSRLSEIAPQTLMKIGAFIKENPSEFIIFV
jgi:hypothetical protein